MRKVVPMKQQGTHTDPLLHSPAAKNYLVVAEDISSCCSLQSFRTKDTDVSSSAFYSSASSSSSFPPAVGATAETELEECRRFVRTLRREAQARATDLARLRIQAEALGAEWENMKKCRDMCEYAMAEVRDLRAERDELREILLSVMRQQERRQDLMSSQEDPTNDAALLAEKEHWLDEKDRDELQQGRRQTSNFSSLSYDDDEQQDDDKVPNANDESFRRQQRRSSLLEGVGAFLSGVVKELSSTSMNSLHRNLVEEIQPQGQARLVVPHQIALPNCPRQRRASAVVSSSTTGGTPLRCGHAGIVEERRGSVVMELDDIEKLRPGRVERHSSMPQLSSSYGGKDDSSSSLSSWNVTGGGAQSDDDDKGTDFLSWEESRRSLWQEEESSSTHAKEERKSSSSDRRRRSSSRSCLVASRRDTEKDVEDFVASMMLSGALGELMDDEEIAADYDDNQ